MTDPQSDRPAYRQVADQLRVHIESGEWPPGHKLPSESELMAQFGVSRVTVRLAVGALRAEGLIVTKQGRGSFVRDREANRRISSTRYLQDARYAAGRVAEPATGFGEGSTPEECNRHRLEPNFHEERAGQLIADLLGLEVGQPVLKRQYVLYVDGRPEEISTSYLPMDLVRDTAVADHHDRPRPGGDIAQLASLGHRVTRVVENVRARMPKPEEGQRLHIPSTGGVPVLVITRRMFTGPGRDHPVEATVDIVLPGDRVELEYIVDLDE